MNDEVLNEEELEEGGVEEADETSSEDEVGKGPDTESFDDEDEF